MAPHSGSKRARFDVIFSTAAQVLVQGKRAVIRPESMHDYRTILNYWYTWRRVHYGIGIKSKNEATRMQASIVLDSRIKVDTDDKGQLVLVLSPYITPPVAATGQLHVQVLEDAEASTLVTDHGASVAQATSSEMDHYMQHTVPWRKWFDGRGGMDKLLRCLDSIPREMRANPDLASLDDLPLPDSPEGLAWKARFETLG